MLLLILNFSICLEIVVENPRLSLLMKNTCVALYSCCHWPLGIVRVSNGKAGECICRGVRKKRVEVNVHSPS